MMHANAAWLLTKRTALGEVTLVGQGRKLDTSMRVLAGKQEHHVLCCSNQLHYRRSISYLACVCGNMHGHADALSHLPSSLHLLFSKTTRKAGNIAN
eukprot:355658-Chlamydomonas_euryale.AAC.11